MKNYQWALIVLCLQLIACTTTPTTSDSTLASDNAADSPALEAEDVTATVPTRPFPGDSLHDLLVAEFAVRRNRYDLALGNYLQQSHETRDAGVAARATRLAQFLMADKATLDSALLWVELEPQSAEAQYTASTILAKNKRPLEAMQHMILVLQNGGTTNFAAIVASALPLPESTRLELEAIVDNEIIKHPQHSQLLTSKSLLLQQREQKEQALTVIRKALTLNEQDLHAIVIEARLLQQLKREDEAFTRLEQVLAQHPDNTRLRLQYARMLMSKDIDKAKQQFEILLEQSPTDGDLLLSLALINKETNHTQAAKGYFETLLKLGERVNETHYYLGQISEADKDWQKAIDHYKAISSGVDLLAASNRIASLYLRLSNVQMALKFVAAQRKQYPEHAIPLYLLESEILLGIQHFDAGNQLLTQALLVHSKHPSLLYARSIFSEKRQDFALMEQDLRQIIQQDDKNVTALNALGYVLANRSDRLDEAHQLISRALQLKPEDPAIVDSLGWVEFRRGNFEQAQTLLEKAYKSYPDHEVAAHLGEVLWVKGQQQQALSIWTEALKKSPKSPQLNETILRLTGTKPVIIID